MRETESEESQEALFVFFFSLFLFNLAETIPLSKFFLSFSVLTLDSTKAEKQQPPFAFSCLFLLLLKKYANKPQIPRKLKALFIYIDRVVFLK